MMMLVTSIETACSKCPMLLFARLEPFADNSIAVLIWALRQASADRLHTVLQFFSFSSVSVGRLFCVMQLQHRIP